MTRAFTLLETVLAVVMGAVVSMAAFSMMFTMERTDRLLAARSEQTGDLQRARLVMQRTFLNVLMAPPPPPAPRRPRIAVAKDANQPETPAPPAPEAPKLTPRLILDADPRLQGLTMTRKVDQRAFGVQRLEIVLADSPVPDDSRDAWAFLQAGVPERRERREPTPDRPSVEEQVPSETSAADEEAQVPVRAVRGAFEFWPQIDGGSQRKLEEIEYLAGREIESPILWELWWVPVPARGDHIDDPPPISPPLAEPYLIASNIRYARWTMYDDRERKVRLAVAERKHLPAYVELEVETGVGLIANWMFETDAHQGPESRKPKADPAGGNADRLGEGGEGGGGGGGGTGAGGGGTGTSGGTGAGGGGTGGTGGSGRGGSGKSSGGSRGGAPKSGGGSDRSGGGGGKQKGVN